MDAYYDGEFDFLVKRKCEIHPSLRNSIERAALEGGPLLPINKSLDYWQQSAKYIVQNYSEYDEIKQFESDVLFYYHIHTFGWYLPSKESIDLIIKHSDNNQPILEIGGGLCLMSKILSHHRQVIPTDIKQPSQKYAWMQPQIIDLKESIPQNPNSFILTVYPYNDMIHDIFDLAQVGQKLGIILPPLSGISDEEIDFLYDEKNYKVLDVFHSFISDFGNPKIKDIGVIVQKVSNNKFPKLSTNARSDYTSWSNARKREQIRHNLNVN